MNASRNRKTRTLNCLAIHTLDNLRLTLERQIRELEKVPCEDAGAGVAIVFAIEAAEKSLIDTLALQRKYLRGEEQPVA